MSWYPPNDADNEGKNPDKLIPLILDLANKYQLKVKLIQLLTSIYMYKLSIYMYNHSPQIDYHPYNNFSEKLTSVSWNYI